MGYSEDEFRKLDEGFIPEASKQTVCVCNENYIETDDGKEYCPRCNLTRDKLRFADLSDTEIEEGLTALHGTTELDMEAVEEELRATSSEYQHYRQKQLREGFSRLKQIEELQGLLAQESRKVGDAVKQVEASIEFFENQCRMGEGLKVGEYEKQQFRAYRIAHRAAISALKAVKRELEREPVK